MFRPASCGPTRAATHSSVRYVRRPTASPTASLSDLRSTRLHKEQGKEPVPRWRLAAAHGSGSFKERRRRPGGRRWDGDPWGEGPAAGRAAGIGGRQGPGGGGLVWPPPALHPKILFMAQTRGRVKP